MKLPDPLRKILISLMTALYSAILGFIAAILLITPTYTASSKCYVSDQLSNEIVSESAIKILDKNFMYFVTSDGFYQNASRITDYTYSTEELKKMIKVSHIKDTNMYSVSVKADNSSDAYQLQLMIAESLENYIYSKSGHSMQVNFIETADIPDKPSRTPHYIVAAIVGIIGLAVSIAVQRRIPKEDPGIITPVNIQQYCDYPVMARIFELPHTVNGKHKNGSEGIIKPEQTLASAYSYQYEELFEQIKFASENPCCIISVCSSVRHEGKSQTAVGLAVAAASNRMKVLLIDADFHHGNLSEYFDFTPEHQGLSDIIFNNIRPTNAIMLTEFKTLYVMGPGTLRDNSRAAFSPAAFQSALDKLRYMFNYIIIDTPDLNGFSDAAAPIIASDVSLLTIRSGYTYANELWAAQDHLRLSNLDVNIKGVILNRINQDSAVTRRNNKKTESSGKKKSNLRKKAARKKKLDITV